MLAFWWTGQVLQFRPSSSLAYIQTWLTSGLVLLDGVGQPVDGAHVQAWALVACSASPA